MPSVSDLKRPAVNLSSNQDNLGHTCHNNTTYTDECSNCRQKCVKSDFFMTVSVTKPVLVKLPFCFLWSSVVDVNYITNKDSGTFLTL